MSTTVVIKQDSCLRKPRNNPIYLSKQEFSQAPEEERDPSTYIHLIVDPHKTVQNPREKPSFTSSTSDIKGPRRSGTDTAQSADTYRWWLSEGDSCCRLQLLTRQRGLLFLKIYFLQSGSYLLVN